VLIGKEYEFKDSVITGSGYGLEVKKRCIPVPARKATIVGGIPIAVRKLGINGRSVGTLATALYGRVLFYDDGNKIAEPVKCRVNPNRNLGSYRTRLVSCFGYTPTPLSPQEFVEMYKGRRKTIYQNAKDDLDLTKVERKDSFINPFVKCEKVKLSSCPRVIQPRNPRYNVSLGVYIKHVEHDIYRAIARVAGQSVVVAKGLNVAQLGEVMSDLWNQVDDCIYVGLDASRFDMHVGVEMLRWEHSVYLELYNNDPVLRRLLSWQLETKGKGWCEDGSVKYHVRGRRASGDMNTGLGNC